MRFGISGECNLQHVPMLCCATRLVPLTLRLHTSLPPHTRATTDPYDNCQYVGGFDAFQLNGTETCHMLVQVRGARGQGRGLSPRLGRGPGYGTFLEGGHTV